MIAFVTGGWDCFHCLCHIDCIMTDIKHGWVGGSCIESWYITVNCMLSGNSTIMVYDCNLYYVISVDASPFKYIYIYR